MGSPPKNFGHFRASQRVKPQCFPCVRPTRAQGQRSLSDGQRGLQRPAHAGTGATSAPGATPLASRSGPRGHRGNDVSGAVGYSAAVRPTRAQGQQATWVRAAMGRRPAHAGTGATGVVSCLHEGLGCPAHAGTGATTAPGWPTPPCSVRPTRAHPQRVRPPMPAKTSSTAEPPADGAGGGEGGVCPPAWGGACRGNGGRRRGPSGPPSPGPPARHPWQGWGPASRGQRGPLRVPAGGHGALCSPCARLAYWHPEPRRGAGSSGWRKGGRKLRCKARAVASQVARWVAPQPRVSTQSPGRERVLADGRKVTGKALAVSLEVSCGVSSEPETKPQSPVVARLLTAGHKARHKADTRPAKGQQIMRSADQQGRRSVFQ